MRYAVLVAESITSRFFNVIQILSHSIPVIAVQANIVEADGKRLLHFSKVMATYVEPEDEVNISNEKHDEEYWRTKAVWTVEAAKSLLEVVQPVYMTASLNFVKNYIAIDVNNNNYIWLHGRSGGKSLLCFWFSEGLLPQAIKLLDEAGLSYVRKTQTLKMTIDKQMIETNAELLKEIAKLVQQSWKA